MLKADGHGASHRSEESRYSSTMRLLEYLVEMFIQGFGITRPNDAQRRRVTLVLGGALSMVLLLAMLLSVGMVLYLHHSH